ncbi:MAG: hypothetical protein KDA80_13995 [Planctomycetaceae bacterium]|nr:hypothetical protein [Planctomycetaceae bacterium]
MATHLEISERLADQLERLNEELAGICDVLHEIRVDLAWALQNGRVTVILDDQDVVADATVNATLLELTVRLQADLALFGTDLREMIDVKADGENGLEPSAPTVEALTRLSSKVSEWNEPKPQPRQQSLFAVDSSAKNDSLPPITLFEVGETVEFLYDRRGQKAEILHLDDARSSATVRLIEKGVQMMVSQDAIRKVGEPTGEKPQPESKPL